MSVIKIILFILHVRIKSTEVVPIKIFIVSINIHSELYI